MNCNCIKEVEAKVKEFHQPKVNAPIESVRCKNISFIFGEVSEIRIGIPFRIKADAPGYRSQKGKEMMVHVSFCPFCGVDARPKAKVQACK